MKTLVVLEGNCGDDGQKYRAWLEENLPDDIELDFRANSGIGGDMYDDDDYIIEGEANIWWNKYCNSL